MDAGGRAMQEQLPRSGSFLQAGRGMLPRPKRFALIKFNRSAWWYQKASLILFLRELRVFVVNDYYVFSI